MTDSKINRIVADVLGVAIEEIEDDTSPDSASSWDSMAHLNLVMALEAEFGISLAPEDVTEMLSVRQIKSLLAANGAQ